MLAFWKGGGRGPKPQGVNPLLKMVLGVPQGVRDPGVELEMAAATTMAHQAVGAVAHAALRAALDAKSLLKSLVAITLEKPLHTLRRIRRRNQLLL